MVTIKEEIMKWNKFVKKNIKKNKKKKKNDETAKRFKILSIVTLRGKSINKQQKKQTNCLKISVNSRKIVEKLSKNIRKQQKNS